MPIIRALGLILLGLTVVAGQQPNPAGQKANLRPSDLCSVEGVVAKSTTGEGIKRATVQLTPLDAGLQPYSAPTESNGRFMIRDILPGRYAIFASGDGYSQEAPQKGKRNTQLSILDLTPGKYVNGISFRLLPPGAITGTVYDDDGDVVIRAQVRALRVVGSGAHRQVGEAGSAQTDDRGQYRIWGLEPGKYLVDATYQSQQSNPNQQTDEVYLPTFHPSTPDTSQASIVEVEPDTENSGNDIDLRQAHAVVIRGRVLVDSQVKSLKGTYVSLTPSTAQGSYSLSTYGSPVQNDSGDFEIRGVPPGPYNLSAFWYDGRRQLYGRVPVDVSGANLDGVNFVLGSPLTLSGRFRVDGNSQIDFTRLGLWLLAIDKAMGSGSAQIRADGTFLVQNVYDGTYRLRLAGFPEEYYVKSAREGGSEVLESGLTISHGQPPSPLEITLSADGGRVDGTVVHDQNPVGGAWVVLAPNPPYRDREEMYSVKVTDDFGRFSLLGLPPGDFKLFAWEHRQGTNYTDPDFLEAFESRGTTVHIEERQPQTVQLEVITTEEQLK